MEKSNKSDVSLNVKKTIVKKINKWPSKYRSHRKDKSLITSADDKRLEEERLEKLIFGHGSDVLELLEDDPKLDLGETTEANAEQTGQDQSKRHSHEELEPAWVDNDAGEFVNNRSQKFETIFGKPKWAEINREIRDSDEEDNDDNAEVFQRCGNLLASGKRTFLQRENLELKRLRNLNDETYAEGPIIKAIEFHPTATVALVAGVSGIATLFQVDGKTNAKLQSVQFHRFPIDCAKISHNGTEFLVGSRHHSHFFSYDMESGQSLKIRLRKEVTNVKQFKLSPDGQVIAIVGRFGNIHIVTARTKEHVDCFKMNGEVTAIAFSADGSYLYSHGDEGKVYVWDMKSRSCVDQFIDDGCVGGTSLAVSTSYLAAGSNAGVVNIYRTAKEQQKNVPLKTLLHLQTSISCLKFNAAEEILAMASDNFKDAIKLVHLPSFTVFTNFPGKFENLWRPQSIAFSPNSGYLAVGNNKGTALLFRLKHYGNY